MVRPARDFKAFEAGGWADRAATYDEVMGAVTARAIEPLLDAAGVRGGTRLLDAACGPGTLAAAAAGRGAEPVGADIAEGMVALARERHPRLRFEVADAEALPFADASFDAVAAGFLIHHLPDPERAVAEFARVLRPGGRLAATVWDRPDRMRLLGLANEAMERAGADPAALPDGPDAFGFADHAEFAALLRGFEAVEVCTLEWTHPAGDPGALWDGLLGGTVRTHAQMRAQPPEVAERVRAAFAELAGREGRDIPVAAVLASGRRA